MVFGRGLRGAGLRLPPSRRKFPAGEPRQLMSVRRYFEDIDAAHLPSPHATRARSHARRPVGHLVRRQPRRRHGRGRCVSRGGRPMSDPAGPCAALALGLLHLARFTAPMISDLTPRLPLDRAALCAESFGRPGELAFSIRPGAYEGWYSVVSRAPHSTIGCRRAPGSSLLFYDAASMARGRAVLFWSALATTSDSWIRHRSQGRRGGPARCREALSGRPLRGRSPADGRAFGGGPDRVLRTASRSGALVRATA